MTSSAQSSHAAREIDKVKAELVAALLEDESRLGEVYRLLQEGLTPEEMADRMQVASPTFAATYQKQVDAILEGRLPVSSTLANQTADKLRRWQRDKEWTPPAAEHLASVLSGLENIATDSGLAAKERTEAAKKTREAESLGLTGIYVYTLPHCLRHLYDPESGRTLFKITHSTMAAYNNLGEKQEVAWPEDPMLLRVYVTEGTASDLEEERHFHEWLQAADHGPNKSSRGNTDWYLTTTKFLDRVARQRGLEITVVSEYETE